MINHLKLWLRSQSIDMHACRRMMSRMLLDHILGMSGVHLDLRLALLLSLDEGCIIEEDGIAPTALLTSLTGPVVGGKVGFVVSRGPDGEGLARLGLRSRVYYCIN